MSRRKPIEFRRSSIPDCCDMCFPFLSVGQEASPEARKFLRPDSEKPIQQTYSPSQEHPQKTADDYHV